MANSTTNGNPPVDLTPYECTISQIQAIFSTIVLVYLAHGLTARPIPGASRASRLMGLIAAAFLPGYSCMDSLADVLMVWRCGTLTETKKVISVGAAYVMVLAAPPRAIELPADRSTIPASELPVEHLDWVAVRVPRQVALRPEEFFQLAHALAVTTTVDDKKQEAELDPDQKAQAQELIAKFYIPSQTPLTSTGSSALIQIVLAGLQLLGAANDNSRLPVFGWAAAFASAWPYLAASVINGIAMIVAPPYSHVYEVKFVDGAPNIAPYLEEPACQSAPVAAIVEYYSELATMAGDVKSALDTTQTNLEALDVYIKGLEPVEKHSLPEKRLIYQLTGWRDVLESQKQEIIKAQKKLAKIQSESGIGEKEAAPKAWDRPSLDSTFQSARNAHQRALNAAASAYEYAKKALNDATNAPPDGTIASIPDLVLPKVSELVAAQSTKTKLNPGKTDEAELYRLLQEDGRLFLGPFAECALITIVLELGPWIAILAALSARYGGGSNHNHAAKAIMVIWPVWGVLCGIIFKAVAMDHPDPPRGLGLLRPFLARRKNKLTNEFGSLLAFWLALFICLPVWGLVEVGIQRSGALHCGVRV